MNLSAEARARFGKDDLPLPPDPNFWEVFNKVVGMQEKQFMKLRDNQVGWSVGRLVGWLVGWYDCASARACVKGEGLPSFSHGWGG